MTIKAKRQLKYIDSFWETHIVATSAAVGAALDGKVDAQAAICHMRERIGSAKPSRPPVWSTKSQVVLAVYHHLVSHSNSIEYVNAVFFYHRAQAVCTSGR